MPNKWFIPAVCLLLCLLSSCGSKERTETDPQAVAMPSESTQAVSQTQMNVSATTAPKNLPPVDYDLTQLSQAMMYAQAYDMLYNSEQYLGKTVRICGPYSAFDDQETDAVHRVCLIQDATACCTQGIEFELSDTSQPLPNTEETFTVSGVFDTYMSGPFLYCVLRDATIE